MQQGDYWTKHHPASHHRQMRSEILMPYKVQGSDGFPREDESLTHVSAGCDRWFMRTAVKDTFNADLMQSLQI
jgi:hypothetical protein